MCTYVGTGPTLITLANGKPANTMTTCGHERSSRKIINMNMVLTLQLAFVEKTEILSAVCYTWVNTLLTELWPWPSKICVVLAGKLEYLLAVYCPYVGVGNTAHNVYGSLKQQLGLKQQIKQTPTLMHTWSIH